MNGNLPKHFLLLVEIRRDLEIFESAAGRVGSLFVGIGNFVDGILVDARFEKEGRRRGSRSDGRPAPEQDQEALVRVLVKIVAHFQGIAHRIQTENPA